MHTISHPRRITRIAVACAIGLVPLLATPLAQAGPLSFFNFSGEGNLLVFDAAAGTGGWNGALTEYSDPGSPLPNPLSLAALVLFDYDAALNALNGNFEFTNAVDLASSIYGTVSGGFTDPAGNLIDGGQLGLDYLIVGGTGQFAGYSGFGLSFLSFDPNPAAFNNYSEQGFLSAEPSAAVPEPASATLLLAAALGWLGIKAVGRRRGARQAG